MRAIFKAKPGDRTITEKKWDHPRSTVWQKVGSSNFDLKLETFGSSSCEQFVRKKGNRGQVPASLGQRTTTTRAESCVAIILREYRIGQMLGETETNNKPNIRHRQVLVMVHSNNKPAIARVTGALGPKTSTGTSSRSSTSQTALRAARGGPLPPGPAPSLDSSRSIFFGIMTRAPWHRPSGEVERALTAYLRCLRRHPDASSLSQVCPATPVGRDERDSCLAPLRPDEWESYLNFNEADFACNVESRGGVEGVRANKRLVAAAVPSTDCPPCLLSDSSLDFSDFDFDIVDPIFLL